jgi:polyisoprenoid-binding protein YceI
MDMHRASLALASLLFVAACDDHTEGVTAAEVAPATPAATAPSAPSVPPPATRETLTVDRASSSIGFTGAKVTGSHDGSFSDFTGTIQLDPGNVTASAVEMTVQIASLHIEPERLSQHLLTPDFFDAAQFPTATFRSTSITEGGTGTVGDRPATHTITGELTMRGTTRTISFPAVVVVTPNEVTAQSEFTIQRRDFGIVYPGMPDDLIRDEVVLRFQMRAPRT